MSKVTYMLDLGENAVSDCMTLDELVEVLRVLEKPSMRDIISNASIGIIVTES